MYLGHFLRAGQALAVVTFSPVPRGIGLAEIADEGDRKALYELRPEDAQRIVDRLFVPRP